MLTTLQIHDLAVVAALDLDLSGGLTVLTGETGAGKSILLTALGLALGDRADSGFVRPGSPRAEVCAEFDLGNRPHPSPLPQGEGEQGRRDFDFKEARQWLEDNELESGDTCLIRRTVASDGRSKAYINDRPVTLQALQEFAANLVEIHGQHAHVKLLQNKEQRRLLDEAAGNAAMLQELEGLYKRWHKLRTELEQASTAGRDRGAREELLRYQVDELETAQVESLDYQALSEEHTRQANLGKILEVGQAQLECLTEDDRHSADALLKHAVQALTDLSRVDPAFDETVALLQEAHIQVKEAGHGLRRHLDGLEADPAHMEKLEQQLGSLHDLARKHQVRPEQLAEHLHTLRSELAGLESGGERLEKLALELGQVEHDYRNAALALSQQRQEKGQALQEQISATIRELGMPQGNFVVEIAPLGDDEPRPHGLDQVDFLVSANPGLPPRPLNKVASGGELSRISLAIQVAVIDGKTTPTLIFDEVDSGIGGRVAEIVGQKLRALGQTKQVLCVTHLPQVAAHGHQHLLVEKSQQGDVTQSNVRQLGHDERIQETARMLGGIRITEQTLAHAREMLGWVG